MLSRFIRLFIRILHGMPTLVSSNWASWLLGGLGMFVLAEAWVWSRGSKGQRFREWWEKRRSSILRVFGFATVYGAVLFGWSTVQTVYDDHHDNTGRMLAVVKEKNSLYADLSLQDNQLTQLRSRSCPMCPSRSVQG